MNTTAGMPVADQYGFVRTFNNTGYMTTYLDEVSQAWVDAAKTSALPSADIGAAYGVATLAALRGSDAKVIAADLDADHLRILQNQAEQEGLADRLQREILNFPWPGNVRQLAAFAKFLVPYLDKVDPHITMAQWTVWKGKRKAEKQTPAENPKENFLNLVHLGAFKYDNYSETVRANFIQWALEMAENNRSEAARLLGVSRQRLVNWLSEVNVKV